MRLFPFKKSRNDRLKIEIDFHSHILPGVDDGVSTLEESVKILGEYGRWGWKKVILTPHIMEGFFISDFGELNRRKEKLQRELEKRGIQVELELGGEHYLDLELIEKVEKGEILPIGKKYLLFELPLTFPTNLVEELVFTTLNQKLVPVLAHPERYLYLELEDYLTLKEWGVLFQSTIGSFGGRYGKVVKKRALLLAHHGLIDFLGSDTHSWTDFRFTQQLLTSPSLGGILSSNPIRNRKMGEFLSSLL
jgi:tyrosine-protein phosphatase YwqE